MNRSEEISLCHNNPSCFIQWSCPVNLEALTKIVHIHTQDTNQSCIKNYFDLNHIKFCDLSFTFSLTSYLNFLIETWNQPEKKTTYKKIQY